MNRALLSLLLVASTAHAVELNYTWTKGDVHRFAYADDSTINLSMMGMPSAPMRISVTSTFSEKILGVRPDGSADVELTVEKLDVKQGGKSVATIDLLPAASRKVLAVVDRKGRFTFERMVSVYLSNNQPSLVVSGSAGPGKASATASSNGTTLKVVAAYDPKTGRLSASGSVTQTEEKAPEAKAEIREEDPHVDALPKQLLALMILPDGDLEPGATMTVRSMLGDLSFGLAPLEAKTAKLRVRLDGNDVQLGAGKVKATNPNDGTTTELGEDPPPDMAMGMPGMPGMGAQPTAGAQQNVDLLGTFDLGKGRLLGVEGAVSQTMSMGGMGGLTVAGTFSLKRLP